MSNNHKNNKITEIAVTSNYATSSCEISNYPNSEPIQGSKKPEYNLIVPLFNFQANNNEPIIIDNNVKLIETPNDLKDNQNDKSFSFQTKLIGSLDIKDNSLQQEARHKFDWAVILLKLFKEEMIWANKFRIVNISNSSIFSTGQLNYYIWWWKNYYPKQYEINNDDVKLVQKFWNDFSGLDINFGVMRFHQGDYRPQLTDCLVDYVIALEYFLVPGGKSGDISYKFRTHGALVLSQCNISDTDPHNIYKNLKKAYDLRSDIVHGNIKTNYEDFSFVKTIRNYTREVIKYFHNNKITDREKYFKELILGKVKKVD